MTDTSVTEPVGRVGDPRAEKIAVVDEVREKLSGAGAAILTEYRGLKVAELETLRRSLRRAGGEYKIYKNTLVRFATRDLGMDGLDALLVGPTAIAFASDDVPGVAKALRDFSRTNPLLVVKGGVMGTSVLTAGDAAALAEIPSREVLLAQFAGLMAAPLQQFAGLLQALPRNFAYGLKALIDQGGAAGAPTDEPEAQPQPEAHATPDAEPEPAPEPEPQASPEPEPQAAPDAEAHADALPEPDAQTEAQPEPEAAAPDTEPPSIPEDQPNQGAE